MSSIKYTSTKNIIYDVSTQYINNKIIVVLERKENENNLQYKNEYEFNFLKERLKPLYYFETAKAFNECLLKNIKEKTLIIEEVYQNIIKTKWIIITGNKKQEKCFIILLKLTEEEQLSIIFASSNPQAKIINKLIKENLDLCWGVNFISNFVSEDKKNLDMNMFFLIKRV